ncbi:MAG: hypothetical protein NTY81_01425 [Candidatus Staskawiczbacteria bacterium]|nr:hypothetical protein [Candidatus Staskawiczbacteria bacterium]
MNQENRQEKEEEYNPFVSLKDLRDNWSDEIPEKILEGGKGEENPTFKVRTNWWNGVTGNMGLLLEDKMLPEELVEETEKFIKKFSGRSSILHLRLPTAEDIAEANAMIDKVLDSQK